MKNKQEVVTVSKYFGKTGLFTDASLVEFLELKEFTGSTGDYWGKGLWYNPCNISFVERIVIYLPNYDTSIMNDAWVPETYKQNEWEEGNE